MEVAFDERELLWGKRRLVRFTPAAEIEVIGFENRYRQPGIGAPLAAATQPVAIDEPAGDFIGPNVHVPATALLRLAEPRWQLASTQLTGTLELRPATESLTTEIDGRDVPLELEPTAALAISVAAAQPWTQELSVFLGRGRPKQDGPRLIGGEAHPPGGNPPGLVAGTASKPTLRGRTSPC
jgi:hypothetical protein